MIGIKMRCNRGLCTDLAYSITTEENFGKPEPRDQLIKAVRPVTASVTYTASIIGNTSKYCPKTFPRIEKRTRYFELPSSILVKDIYQVKCMTAMT